MTAIRPAVFTADNLADGWWLGEPANRAFRDFLLSSGARFPSVLVGFAGRPGLAEVADGVAAGISQAGLNVFLSDAATPISALTQAVGQRRIPLGLYLDEAPDGVGYTLLAVGNHGGPITEADLPEVSPSPLGKLGVIGSTDLATPYLNGLRSLLDPYPDPQPRLSSLEHPFPHFEKTFGERAEYRLFTDRLPNGPAATISPDGQSLRFAMAGEEPWTTRAMAERIGHYLTRVRRTSGTIIGAKGVDLLSVEAGNQIRVEGGPLELSSRASFVDLLIGWWEPGIVAHQGFGPFGDAFLTLAYLLEAMGESGS